MSKRTIALIIALILVTIILFSLALASSKKPVTPPITPSTPITTESVPSPTIAPGHTLLFFTPSTLPLSSSSGSVSIDIDSGGDNVSAVQLELQYDPKVLTNVDIIPGTYFPVPLVLLKKVNQQDGRISFALGTTSTDTNKVPTGTVAKLTFQVLPSTSQTTQITFLPKTLVTATGIDPSVLKSTTPLMITLPAKQ